MNMAKSILAALIIGSASAVQAASVSWYFYIPATGSPSIGTDPYPVIAVLSLVDVTGVGVQFTLDPNESHPGFDANSSINRLEFSYQDDTQIGVNVVQELDWTDFAWVSGPMPTSFDGGAADPAGDANWDSGYKSLVGANGGGSISMDWGNDFLTSGASSVWIIKNTTIGDNFSVLGDANNKNGPTFGVISVADVDQKWSGWPTPDPSNWVTGDKPLPPGYVPIPAAAWLFGSALIGTFMVGRRRKQQV